MRIPLYLLNWFKQKEWQMHPYQKKMFVYFFKNQSTLLVAPTGGGKTLASFLPSLIDIHETAYKGLHTLYISPLKALTTDIKRNLLSPIADMGLAVSVETRTGDTTAYQRKRQLKKPPTILLTTPESLMLLLSYPDAPTFFAKLKSIIIDELHNLAGTKRGDLTALALARIKQYSPQALRFGLSATVAHPDELAAWLNSKSQPATILQVLDKQKPKISLLLRNESIPYSGQMAKYAIPAIYNTILQNSTTLIFVNTRSQAEFIFRQLWDYNQDKLAIAIYHGSLSKEQRAKTESLAALGKLHAIVTTSALELGIDWGNIDCVIQIGAPKGISRLLQRIGRSNHQYNKPSLAKLVPTNCFDTLECQAAIDAINQGNLDGEPLGEGSLDVVVQFIINCACNGKITENGLYQIVKSAYPYHDLEEAVFNQLFQFAIDGGYTLKHYEQYHRLISEDNEQYIVASPQVSRRHRQNIGTIIESARLKVKIFYKRKTVVIGEIEENFAQQLTPGDTFLFSGEILSFIRIKDMYVEVKKSTINAGKLPTYEGNTLPFSSSLAEEVYSLINTPSRWNSLPNKTCHWLHLQKKYSAIPNKNNLLIELFRYKKLPHLICYTFEGKRANYTLGMLLTRRIEQLQLKPIGFTASDYGLAICTAYPIDNSHIDTLFNQTILMNELDDWLNQSPLLKRTFRHVAIISGLIERQIAGSRKTMKQVTFSTDLIYDVLLRYEPAHVLLKITRHDAAKILLDTSRLQTMLNRIASSIQVSSLPGPSPFAAPLLATFRSENFKTAALELLLAQGELERETTKLIDEVRKRVE